MRKNILFTGGHEIVIVRGLFTKCMHVLMKIFLFDINYQKSNHKRRLSDSNYIFSQP